MGAKRSARWALALLPIALLLAALKYTAATDDLGLVIARVGGWTWAAALIGQMLSYSARAARLLASEPLRYRGRFWTCLRLILINNALNLALPLRAGEASFPLLLKRWFGTDLAQATGTLIWMRLLDLQVLAVAALLSFYLLKTGDDVGLGWQLSMLLLMAAPVLLWALYPVLLRNLGRQGFAGLVRRTLAGVPAQARVLIVGWLWTLLSWGVKLAVLGHLLAVLGNISRPIGMLGAIGADLSTVLPLHSPGGFGSFEAGIVAFVSIGRPPGAELLAAALGFHLFVLGFALLAGLAAWLLPDAGTAQPSVAKTDAAERKPP